MAINAGTGVPAGIFLRRVIDPDGKHIAGASLQGRSEIDKEAREAVGMRIELLPVEIDLGVHVDALELDAHALAFPVCRGLPMVAIPADAGGKKAALPAHRRFRVHLALDAPVVRQGHRPPVGIGKVRGRSVLRIARGKISNRRRCADAGAASPPQSYRRVPAIDQKEKGNFSAACSWGRARQSNLKPWLRRIVAGDPAREA